MSRQIPLTPEHRAETIAQSQQILQQYQRDKDADRAREEFKKRHDAAEKDQDAFAQAYWGLLIAGIALSTGDSKHFEDAVNYAEKSKVVFLALNERALVGQTNFYLGNINKLRGRSEDALRFFDEALPVFAEALRLKPEAKDLAFTLASVQGMRANILSRSDPSKALEIVTEALPLTDSLVIHATLYDAQGYAYHQQGKRDLALESYGTARKKAEQSGMPFLIAEVRCNMGIVYADTGDWKTAETHYQFAYTYYFANNEFTSVAAVENARGIIALGLGKLDAALDHFLRAEDFYNKAIPIDEQGVLITLRNIGITYQQLGDVKNAETFYQNASKRFPCSADTKHTANIYLSLGSLKEANARDAAKTGDYATTLTMFQKAREYYEKARGDFETLHLPASEAAAYLKTADTYFTEGILLGKHEAHRTAATYYEKGIQRLQNANRPVEAATYSYAIINRLFAGEIDAREAEKQLLAVKKENTEPFGEIELLHSLFITSAARGDGAATSRYLNEFERVWQTARQNLILSEEQQVSLGTLYSDTTRVHVEVLALSHYPEAAFEVLQKSKAKVLVTRVADTQSKELQPLRTQIAFQVSRMAAMNDAQKESERIKLNSLRKEYAAKKSALLKRDARARSCEMGLTLREIAQSLPADTAILEFSLPTLPYFGNVGGLFPGLSKKEYRHPFLFVCTRSGVRAYPINCSPDKLRLLIDSFQTQVKNSSGAVSDWVKQSQALYALLIAPAEAQIRGKRRLVICPDSQLWEVPFVALGKDPVKNPLLTQFEICYNFSASCVAGQLSVPARQIPVLQNPVMISLGNVSNTSEAKDVESKFGQSSRVRKTPNIMVSKSTTKAALKKALEQRQVTLAYVAAHGGYEEESYIEIEDSNTGTIKNKHGINLHARELADFDLTHLSLLVLAVCRMDEKEKAIDGEGPIGMAWAACAAGCRAQVLAYWPVSVYRQVVPMMKKFYPELVKWESKPGGPLTAFTEAARLKQRELVRNPSVWASFGFFGDWR